MTAEANKDKQKPQLIERSERTRERVVREAPALIESVRGLIVFGPGLDDINEYDDPC